jgi:hypothetical protein
MQRSLAKLSESQRTFGFALRTIHRNRTEIAIRKRKKLLVIEQKEFSSPKYAIQKALAREIREKLSEGKGRDRKR